MRWKKPTMVVLTAVIAAALTMQSAYSLQGGRTISKGLATKLKAQPRKTVPQFQPGTSSEQKLKAVREIDQVLRTKPAGEFHEAVRMWQGMSENEKVSLLSGQSMTNYAPAGVVVVAVVAFAYLGYQVGKNEASKKIQQRSMKPDELDVIDRSLGELQGALLDASSLDYAVR